MDCIHIVTAKKFQKRIDHVSRFFSDGIVVEIEVQDDEKRPDEQDDLEIPLGGGYGSEDNVFDNGEDDVFDNGMELVYDAMDPLFTEDNSTTCKSGLNITGWFPGLNAIEAPSPPKWRHAGCIYPRPLITTCPCGNGSWRFDKRNVICFYKTTAEEKSLSLFECVSCKWFLQIPSLNENTLEPQYIGKGLTSIHVTLIHEYQKMMINLSSTFYGFMETLKLTYEESSSKYHPPNLSIYRESWFTWTKLEHNVSTLGCPICGPDPEVLLMDATALSFGNDKKLKPSDPRFPNTMFKYWREPSSPQLHLLDSKTSCHVHDEDDGNDGGLDKDCNKMWSKYTGKTGGLFTVLCRHAQFMGWHIVLSCEGRKDPFFTLENFCSKPPR